jgi:DNA-binding SARP family transcriptional activator
VRYRVLGPLQVWTGSAWSPVRAGQQRVVLAVLLAEAGRVVSADRLVDEIWGERPPRSASTTLQGYVARLRRLLGTGREGPLATHGRGYELTVGDGELDAADFRALVVAGRRAMAADDLDAALPRLTEGLALWRGPALADVPATPTVTGYVNRLEASRLDALEARLDVLLSLDNHVEAAALARTLVDEHPLREPLWALLMRALYRGARRAEALETYQQARRVLATELGLEPGPDLRELQQAILADTPIVTVPRSRSAMGSHVMPAQLPADVAGFTGRKLPLKQLDELAGTGLVTIAGAAGVGKTALAVHWAHQILDRFPDGQLYANLRGYAAGAPLRSIEALSRFLSALGVPDEAIPADEEAASVLYRSLLAGTRMLVLLDNARDPEQVRPLLPGGSGSLAIVTSRDRLTGLAVREGAAGLDLDALTPHEAHTLLVRVLGAERLAVEPEGAAELTALCGHLPLALRIAAANLTAHPHATISGYVAELRRDRLAALEIVGEPMGGVRAAFDHSYSSLSDPARNLFRLLGLVPGPDVTAEAAGALAGLARPQAAALLERLTSAHLVEEHAEHRYTMHDLVREYAAEQADRELSGPDRSGALGRLCDYYLRSVDAAAGHLYPEILRLPMPDGDTGPAARFDDHVAALSWLDAERSNLVACVASAPPAAAWRLADALRGYLMLHQHPLEWSDVASAGLAAAGADGDVHGLAAAHLSLGGLHWSAARYEQAIAHYTPALALTRRAGWAEGEAATLGNLGLLHWLSGEPREAAEHLSAALAVDERTGRLAGRATNLSNLGLVYGALGRLALAAEQLTEALDAFRRIGSRGGEAAALASLGETCHELGRLDEAQGILSQALALHRELGERSGEAETLRFLACVQRDLGRSGDALELAEAAVALAHEVGYDQSEAEARLVAASVRVQRGEYERSVEDGRRALELARRGGHRYTEAKAQVGLAIALLHAGAPKEAAGLATAALAIARRSGYRVIEGNALAALAAIELGHGRLGEAIDRAGQALAVHIDTGLRLGQAHTHLLAVEALRAAGRTEEAETHGERARAILAESGARPE